MSRKSLGDRLRESRRSRGWSQERLASIARLPQSHVARIERGADARLSTLQRVATALGLDLTLQSSLEKAFRAPVPGSGIARARDYGLDLGQLRSRLSMTPKERLDLAARNAEGLAELTRR